MNRQRVLCFDYGHRHVGDVVASDRIGKYLLDRLGVAAMVSVDCDTVKISVMSQQCDYSHNKL